MNIPALLKTTLHFDWLSLKRSPQFVGKIITRILTVVMTVYLLLNLVVLGYFFDILIKKQSPDMDIITLTNRYIIFLFVFLLAFRFFFEKLPQADFHIFLCLPVSKNDLILAYIIRLMGKKLNLLPLFVTIPFWLKNILSIHDFAASIYWLIGFITISFAFALLGLLLKFIFFEMKWGIIVLICAMALIIGLDNGSSAELLIQGSSFIFDSLLQRDISMLISCVLLPVPFIILTYKALQKTFYLDYN